MKTNKIDIEEQYRLYLKKANLDEKDMGEVQRTETKKAFMGGMGQAVMFIYKETILLDEDEITKMLEDFYLEVINFWKSQCNM
jgi:hypothetical protein